MAECTKGHRERLRPWRMHRNAHTPPEDGCTCGVYAMFNPGDLAHFFRTTVMGPRVHYHVFGRVFLWGDVVEGRSGWRASHRLSGGAVAAEMDYHIARSVGLNEGDPGLEDYGLPLHVRGDIAPRSCSRAQRRRTALEETRRRRTDRRAIPGEGAPSAAGPLWQICWRGLIRTTVYCEVTGRRAAHRSELRCVCICDHYRRFAHHDVAGAAGVAPSIGKKLRGAWLSKFLAHD